MTSLAKKVRSEQVPFPLRSTHLTRAGLKGGPPPPQGAGASGGFAGFPGGASGFPGGTTFSFSTGGPGGRGGYTPGNPDSIFE